jgi:hypothetical protein
MALLVVWVLQVSYKNHLRHELEVAEEAAVLAVANHLVDDFLLTEDPQRQQVVEKRALEAGRSLAALHHVGRHPLFLKENPANETNGDLILGTLIHPFSREFAASAVGRPELYHPNRNAVRAAVQRRGVGASVTAFVDRDVIGFKIAGAMTVVKNGPSAIPVAPLALLTDPAPYPRPEEWAERDRASWEYRILARKGLENNGQDFYRLDPKTGRPEPGSDNVPEIRITLLAGADENDPSAGGERHRANGRLVGVGVNQVRRAIRQFLQGITAPDLLPRGGKLLLGEGQGLTRNANRLLLPRLEPSTADLPVLAQALTDILGQPRVWMLYSEASEEGPTPALNVVGFVAARVMQVETSSSDGKGGVRRLSFILQPCMLVTATAVTDFRRRDLGPRTLFNPYVCKVRLVE